MNNITSVTLQDTSPPYMNIPHADTDILYMQLYHDVLNTISLVEVMHLDCGKHVLEELDHKL